jgi:hypothetical protein
VSESLLEYLEGGFLQNVSDYLNVLGLHQSIFSNIHPNHPCSLTQHRQLTAISHRGTEWATCSQHEEGEAGAANEALASETSP